MCLPCVHIRELVEWRVIDLEWLLNSMTKMMKVSVLAVVLLGAAIPFAASLDSANPDLTLTSIERKIDLSTQLVKVTFKPSLDTISYISRQYH